MQRPAKKTPAAEETSKQAPKGAFSLMFLPQNYLETFKEFLKYTGCPEIFELDNPYQPNYKWSWRGKFFWAYSEEGGIRIYGDGGLQELNSLWEQCLREATEDEDASVPTEDK